MADIKNQEDFERWLDGKPAVFAQAIAARCALRALPLITMENRYDLTIPFWRAVVTSWATLNYPARDMTANATDAAYAAYAAAREADAAGHAASAASHAAAYAADAAADAAHAAHATASATADADAYAAIHADADWLEALDLMTPEGIARNLNSRPLWPQHEPEGFTERWAITKAEFVRFGGDWDIWVDWYEQRIVGSPIAFTRLPIPYDDITASIAMQSNAFWDRPPADVNAEIKARLDEENAKLKPSPNTPLPGAYIIGQKDGKLDAEPVPPNISNEKFADELLRGLRHLSEDAYEELEACQAPSLLKKMVQRLQSALETSIHDLPFGTLLAISDSLTAHAESYDFRALMPYQETIKGALTGLSASLRNLLATSAAVRENRASVAALGVTGDNLSEIIEAKRQYADKVAQSGLATSRLNEALRAGDQEIEALEDLKQVEHNDPVQLQKILKRQAEIVGLDMVTTFNVTQYLKTATKDVNAVDFAALLVILKDPIMALVVIPAFVIFKHHIQEFGGGKSSQK